MGERGGTGKEQTTWCSSNRAQRHTLATETQRGREVHTFLLRCQGRRLVDAVVCACQVVAPLKYLGALWPPPSDYGSLTHGGRLSAGSDSDGAARQAIRHVWPQLWVSRDVRARAKARGNHWKDPFVPRRIRVPTSRCKQQFCSPEQPYTT